MRVDLLGLWDAAFKAIVARPRALVQLLARTRGKSAFPRMLKDRRTAETEENCKRGQV